MYSGIVIDRRHLNIRKTASDSAEIVGTVDVFDKIFVDLEASEGDFYKVKTASGIEGYCAKDYIGKLEDEHGECVHPEMSSGGSGGVMWLQLDDPNGDVSYYHVVDSEDWNVFASTNNRRVTFAEFEEAFANGIVRIARWGVDDTQYYVGTVVGYNLNGGNVTLNYNNGSDPSVQSSRVKKFAEE